MSGEFLRLVGFWGLGLTGFLVLLFAVEGCFVLVWLLCYFAMAGIWLSLFVGW